MWEVDYSDHIPAETRNKSASSIKNKPLSQDLQHFFLCVWLKAFRWISKLLDVYLNYTYIFLTFCSIYFWDQKIRLSLSEPWLRTTIIPGGHVVCFQLLIWNVGRGYISEFLTKWFKDSPKGYTNFKFVCFSSWFTIVYHLFLTVILWSD